DGGGGTTPKGGDYNAHLWAVSATYDDIRQGTAGTCVFLSSLSSAAMQGNLNLAGRITYLGHYNYAVKLYNPDSEQMTDLLVTFDGTKVLDGDGYVFDPGTPSNEFWVLLYQRAYLTMMSVLDLNFKDPDYAMYALTGREVNTFNPGS